MIDRPVCQRNQIAKNDCRQKKDRAYNILSEPRCAVSAKMYGGTPKFAPQFISIILDYISTAIISSIYNNHLFSAANRIG